MTAPISIASLAARDEKLRSRCLGMLKLLELRIDQIDVDSLPDDPDEADAVMQIRDLMLRGSN